MCSVQCKLCSVRIAHRVRIIFGIGLFMHILSQCLLCTNTCGLWMAQGTIYHVWDLNCAVAQRLLRTLYYVYDLYNVQRAECCRRGSAVAFLGVWRTAPWGSWRRCRNKLKFSSETQSVMGFIGMVWISQWIMNTNNLERKHRHTEEKRLNKVKFSSDR